MSACPHGREVGGPGDLAGVLWSGGVSTCACCRQLYGYVDSSSHGRDGLLTSRTMDKTLCTHCGGVVTEYVHPDYEWAEEEYFGPPDAPGMPREGAPKVKRLRRKDSVQ